MTNDREDERLQDEDQADERKDQDVACEHVREKTDAERDQAHELARISSGTINPRQRLRGVGIQLLK